MTTTADIKTPCGRRVVNSTAGCLDTGICLARRGYGAETGHPEDLMRSVWGW